MWIFIHWVQNSFRYTKLRYRAFWFKELFECTASLTVAGPQTRDLRPCLQQHLWYVANLWGWHTKVIQQVQGPWGAPTRTGSSFCEGVTTPITGFKIRFSLAHKAIWCLTVYYGMDGQAFHSVYGSSGSDPLDWGEIFQVKFQWHIGVVREFNDYSRPPDW
jgi:hypothetical protein